MNVLILANFGMGLYKFRKELILELIDNGIEVFVSFPKDEYAEKLKVLGCTFIDTSLERRSMNPIKDIKLFNHYRKIIRQIKPNVVLTYTIKPNVYGGLACQFENIPYITNITGLGTSLESKGALSLVISIIYALGIRKSNHVFFQNEKNYKFFRDKNLLKSEYSILPGSGVNLKEFNFSDLPKNNKVNFVYVGRIMKNKGINEYLEAANYLNTKYNNLEFNVIGFIEEKYENKIKENVKKRIIKYHGIQKDVRPFIEECTAIIQPSYHEGLSNVLLESAAMGRPLIASNISGCKEVVDDGINGFLFERKNTLSLIDTIEKFLKLTEDERAKMGVESRNKVVKEFNRNIVVNEYIKQIEKITGGKTNGK